MQQNDKKINLTAGQKCQYSAMLRAHPGLKQSSKILAETYLDLSEKHGHTFAGQKYLRFLTGISERKMSESNSEIESIGFFTIKRPSNKPIEATPDWTVFERECAKYTEANEKIRAELRKIRAELRSDNEFGSAESADPDRQNLRAGSAESADIISLDNHSSSNHSPVDSSVPSESTRIYNSRIASRQRNQIAPLRGKNGASHRTGSFNKNKTGYHSKPDSSAEKVNQLLCLQRMLLACPKPKEDQEFTNSDIRNAEKGARVRFYQLVRSGVHWRRIETAYANFLKIRNDFDEYALHPVSFLARYDEDITSPDSDLYVPPEVGESDEPVLPEADNDNRLPVRKRVRGSDIDPDDPPF